jgi:hypothetical protein
MLTNEFLDAGPSHDLSSTWLHSLMYIHTTRHHGLYEMSYTPHPFPLKRCRSCHVRANMPPKMTYPPEDLLIRPSIRQHVLHHSRDAPSLSLHIPQNPWLTFPSHPLHRIPAPGLHNNFIRFVIHHYPDRPTIDSFSQCHSVNPCASRRQTKGTYLSMEAGSREKRKNRHLGGWTKNGVVWQVCLLFLPPFPRPPFWRAS